MAASADYSVSLLDSVNFAPSSVVSEVLQNVRTIISTRRGTVPLDRDFGLTWSYIDKPLPVAQMLFRTEIIAALEEYEPRAQVESITFENNTDGAMDGVMVPTLKLRIVETSSSSSESAVTSYAGTTSGSGSSAELYSITVSTSSGSDTAALSAQVSDLESRVQDIEQSDYSELYENGES